MGIEPTSEAWEAGRRLQFRRLDCQVKSLPFSTWPVPGSGRSQATCNRLTAASTTVFAGASAEFGGPETQPRVLAVHVAGVVQLAEHLLVVQQPAGSKSRRLFKIP